MLVCWFGMKLVVSLSQTRPLFLKPIAVVTFRKMTPILPIRLLPTVRAGSIPEELGELDKLEALRLGNNELTGKGVGFCKVRRADRVGPGVRSARVRTV